MEDMSNASSNIFAENNATTTYIFKKAIIAASSADTYALLAKNIRFISLMYMNANTAQKHFVYYI